MADKRKLIYIIRFVFLGWAVIAACAGVVVGLAHLLKDTTLTIMVVQFVVYSGAFGFLGWQRYKDKDKREGWHFEEQKERGWASMVGGKRSRERDEEEADSGWRK
jgi:membrane protein implicated in regulation of membrane protease activity